MRRIAVINQKGGVGKTTLTANLAHALTLQGQSVTAIDMDPQGHLGSSLGAAEADTGIDVVLAGDATLAEQRQTLRQGFDLIPAGLRLSAIERQREHGMRSAQRLRAALDDELSADGDGILLIDCPPSAGLLIADALYSVDEVLIPVCGDYLALKGLSSMLHTVRRFEGHMQRSLRRWIALNRFVQRRRLAGEVRSKLLGHFRNSLLRTEVREAAVLAECPGAGCTIFEYRRSSPAAAEIFALAGDLLAGRTLQE